MTQNMATYYVWIGGSCDYGHKERAGGAAAEAMKKLRTQYNKEKQWN